VQKITKIGTKLELYPLTSRDRELLKELESEGAKVSRLAFRYLRGVLPLSNEDEYKFHRNRFKAILDFSGSPLNKETAAMIFDTCYQNFEYSRKNHGSLPRKFMKDSLTMPIRISKCVNGRYYHRAGTLKLRNNSLLFEASLIKKKKIRFYVNYDKKAFKQIEEILSRKTDVAFGDPSNLIIKKGRVFLYLSFTKEFKVQSPKPKRIMGVDFGEKSFATYFIIDADGEGNSVKRLGAGNIGKSFDEFISDYIERRAAEQRSGKIKPDKTVLGDSLYTQEANQYIYQTMNKLIQIAKQYGVDTIAAENLEGLALKRLRKSKARTHKAWKKTLMKGAGEKKAAHLQMAKEKTYRRLISKFPYRRMIEDLELEAKWNGFNFVIVNSFDTSRRCPRCSTIKEKNRKGNSFVCKECNYSSNADINGALNIAVKAARPDLFKKAGKRVPPKGGQPALEEVIASGAEGEQSLPPATSLMHPPPSVLQTGGTKDAGQIGELAVRGGKLAGSQGLCGETYSATENTSVANKEKRDCNEMFEFCLFYFPSPTASNLSF
jgi:transposase